MKPSSFQYLKPASVHEATRMLTQHRDDCKILAGGQSLVPILNFRLAAPEVLVDINDIAELDYIAVDDDGLTLGALTRWHQIETSAQVASVNPLLVEAVRQSRTIRSATEAPGPAVPCMPIRLRSFRPWHWPAVRSSNWHLPVVNGSSGLRTFSWTR